MSSSAEAVPHGVPWPMPAIICVSIFTSPASSGQTCVLRPRSLVGRVGALSSFVHAAPLRGDGLRVNWRHGVIGGALPDRNPGPLPGGIPDKPLQNGSCRHSNQPKNTRCPHGGIKAVRRELAGQAFGSRIYRFGRSSAITL